MTEPDDLPRRMATLGEEFVLAWTSMPADLPERISASQLRVLLTVRSLGRSTLTELAERLGALPSSATRLCDRLVSAGYLDRYADPENRRFHLIRLTPVGHEVLARIDKHREAVLGRVLGRMPQATRRHLEQGLAAFAAGLDASLHDVDRSSVFAVHGDRPAARGRRPGRGA